MEEEGGRGMGVMCKALFSDSDKVRFVLMRASTHRPVFQRRSFLLEDHLCSFPYRPKSKSPCLPHPSSPSPSFQSSVTLHTDKYLITILSAVNCRPRDGIISEKRILLATYCLFCTLLCSRPTFARRKLPHLADAPFTEHSLSSTAYSTIYSTVHTHNELRAAATLYRTCTVSIELLPFSVGE